MGIMALRLGRWSENEVNAVQYISKKIMLSEVLMIWFKLFKKFTRNLTILKF